MKNWYTREAQVQSLMSDPNQYDAKVDVNVYEAQIDDKYDVEGPGSLFIKFYIQIEARSWGIKDISVSPIGIINVPISITDVESMRVLEEREVTLDLNQIKKEETTGNGVITLGALDLYLDKDFNVDYSNSSLEIMK